MPGFTFLIVPFTIDLSIAYSKDYQTEANQMDNQPKVTLAQAARMVGVHRNTVKNWQREGKLASAEKMFERGIEVWYVSPAEVVEVARQSKEARLGNSLPPIDYTTQPETATAPTAGQQTLDLIRESIVRPLTDLIERQNTTIAEQANRIGRLEAEVEQLKQNTSRQEAPQQAERSKEVSNQAPEPLKKRKWWQRPN